MTASLSSRDRLLDATIEIIDAEGEVGVRVERVAVSAGVTKPSIYHFFRDREGLLVAAQAERYRRSMGPSVALLQDFSILLSCNSQSDFVELIQRGLDDALSPAGAQRRLLRSQVLGSAVTRPELHEAIQAVQRQMVSGLTSMLTYGQRLGWVSTRLPATGLAEWWFGVIQGRHLVESYGDEASIQQFDSVMLHSISEVLGFPLDRHSAT